MSRQPSNGERSNRRRGRRRSSGRLEFVKRKRTLCRCYLTLRIAPRSRISEPIASYSGRRYSTSHRGAFDVSRSPKMFDEELPVMEAAFYGSEIVASVSLVTPSTGLLYPN
jgi:hypothetical protein